MPSVFARIESYKYSQVGAIHREAVRELTNYKNPNYNPAKSAENHYFERMEVTGSMEKWVDKYREKEGISGRFVKDAPNAKNSTNVMCQAMFSVPADVKDLPRDKQLEVLSYCYDFFKIEFPDVPVVEAVAHFDETSPHVHINFLPIVERDHKKRGKEKIFSTSLLMPGKDYFKGFQDRYQDYMEYMLGVELWRNKGSDRLHYAPKEYRELTSEMQQLQQQKEDLSSEVEYYESVLERVKNSADLDSKISLYEQLRVVQKANKLMQDFLTSLFEKYPAIGRIWNDFLDRHSHGRTTNIDKTK